MSRSSAEQVVESFAAPSGPRVGTRFTAAFTAAVLVVVGVSLFALDRIGTSSRNTPARPSVVVVDDSAQLLEAWTSRGLHGVVLVDATRDTGFALASSADAVEPRDWPIPSRDLQDVYRRAVGRRSVVWVGAGTGIVRSVHYVMTPADLEAKIRAGIAAGQPGIAADKRSVTANDGGYLRFLRSSPPADVGGAVVLNIDASYFIDGTPEGLAAQLSGSLSTYRLVTVDRAVDATDVPEAARVSADRMVRMLRAQVSR